MKQFPGGLVAICMSSLALAGCLSSGTDEASPAEVALGLPAGHVAVDPLLEKTLTDGVAMVFNKSVVDAAVSLTNDLYEPTMEVSADGALFITGHTAVVDSTGAPVYGSWDDGKTWSQLPFTHTLTMPGDLPGATPPVTDEIFLVAGDNGWLYGVDITLATFPVNGWADDGGRHAYYNPNAYDEHQAVLQADECTAAPLKDRPWAAYANGALLMVSNPASGPAQIGVLPLPGNSLGFEAPYGVGATTGFGRWNVCAGVGVAPATSAIPGIPDMRDDGLFVVPQRAMLAAEIEPDTQDYLYLTVGNRENLFNLQTKALFPYTTGGEITSVYGHAAFDGDGALFVAITNNTSEAEPNGDRTGQIRVALSTDGAQNFIDRTFVTGEHGQGVRHMYMDGNRFGSGALLVWAIDGDDTDAEGNAVTFDWYTGHLQVGAGGEPVLENVSLAIDEGPRPSAHVTGAAAGPDGRAYLAMYEPTPPRGTPLSVFVQQEGARLPATTQG